MLKKFFLSLLFILYTSFCHNIVFGSKPEFNLLNIGEKFERMNAKSVMIDEDHKDKKLPPIQNQNPQDDKLPLMRGQNPRLSRVVQLPRIIQQPKRRSIEVFISDREKSIKHSRSKYSSRKNDINNTKVENVTQIFSSFSVFENVIKKKDEEYLLDPITGNYYTLQLIPYIQHLEEQKDPIIVESNCYYQTDYSKDFDEMLDSVDGENDMIALLQSLDRSEEALLWSSREKIKKFPRSAQGCLIIQDIIKKNSKTKKEKYAVKKSTASGVLISSKYILTAAHNVLNYNNKQFSKLRFYSGIHYGEEKQGIRIKSIAIHEDFYNAVKDNDEKYSKNDFALLELECDDPNFVNDFNILGHAEDKAFEKIDNAYITGYPGHPPFKGRYQFDQRLNITSISGGEISYSTKTYHGQSGSGIWCNRKEKNSLIGVHTSGSAEKGKGVYLNQDNKLRINKWIENFKSLQN